MSTFAGTGAILRKDLLIEVRGRQSVSAMVLFALSCMVVFHFALRRNFLSGNLAAGVLWVTLLFAAVLAINRLFAGEREYAGIDGILVAPIDRTAIYVAKATALAIYLTALEAVAVPVFLIFFVDAGVGSDLWVLVAVAALANIGLAAVGTLISLLATSTQTPDLLTPLLTLPLMVPVVIAASAATGPVFSATDAADVALRWVLVLGLYDTVFLLLAYAVFDYLLED